MERVTAANIHKSTESRDGVLILFYADWCPFCQAFLKVVHKYAGRLKHHILFANISDENDKLWDMYRINYIPTLISFKQGKKMARKDAVPGVGLQERDLVEADAAF